MRKEIGGLYLTDDELKKAIKANATGNENNYRYGANDTLLDFGSANDFQSENQTGRVFKMELLATGSEDVVVALHAGRYTDVADIEYNGGSVDVLLADGVIGTGNKTLKVISSPRKVKALLSYLNGSPTRLRKLHVRVDNSAQMDNPLVFRRDIPYQTVTDTLVTPSGFQKSSDPTQTVMELGAEELGAQRVLSDKDLLIYTVSAGRKATLTFTFGASIDLAAGINKKYNKALLYGAQALLKA